MTILPRAGCVVRPGSGYVMRPGFPGGMRSAWGVGLSVNARPADAV
ncbi:hypothetical protein RKD41_000479 [Streptomyces tendae]